MDRIPLWTVPSEKGVPERSTLVVPSTSKLWSGTPVRLPSDDVADQTQAFSEAT